MDRVDRSIFASSISALVFVEDFVLETVAAVVAAEANTFRHG
jgi:hypothetical protein